MMVCTQEPLKLAPPVNTSECSNYRREVGGDHCTSYSLALQLLKYPRKFVVYGEWPINYFENGPLDALHDKHLNYCGDIFVHIRYSLLFLLLALQVSLHLPPTSLCCLGALIHHLKAFKLQRVLTLTR